MNVNSEANEALKDSKMYELPKELPCLRNDTPSDYFYRPFDPDYDYGSDDE